MQTLLATTLVLAQQLADPTLNSGSQPGGPGAPMEYLTYLIVFGAVAVFVIVGMVIFGRGWESYEQKYLGEAEQNLESMFLTIPPQNLFYLSFLLFFLIAGSITAYNGNIGAAVAVGSLSFFAPMGALRHLKKKRETTFKNMLVSALQCLGNNLKSGFSLEKSFEQLERETQNPMKQEVRILLQELRLGTSVDDAVDSP